MAQNNEALMDRLKKLLEMSKSTNPNEAAIALGRAQKLMQEHQISMEDISMSDIVEKQEAIPSSLRDKALFTRLAAIVARSFGLEYFFSCEGSSYKNVTFIGPKSRLESACYTYTILARQASNVKKQFAAEERVRQRQEHEFAKNLLMNNKAVFDLFGATISVGMIDDAVKKQIEKEVRKNTRSYIEGWLISVLDKVTEFAQDEHEQNLLECYMEKHHPDLTTMQNRRRYFTNDQFAAFNRGKEDGRDGFDLYRGVNGTPAERLGYKG